LRNSEAYQTKWLRCHSGRHGR